MNLSKKDIERFEKLRTRLFSAIAFENKLSEGYHKSYEGVLEIGLSFPGYFDDDKPPTWNIHLSCYLLCEGRGDDFTGKTFSLCLDQLEKFVEGCEKGHKEIRENGIR